MSESKRTPAAWSNAGARAEVERLRAANAELVDFVQSYIDKFGAKHADEVESQGVKAARAALARAKGQS